MISLISLLFLLGLTLTLLWLQQQRQAENQRSAQRVQGRQTQTVALILEAEAVDQGAAALHAGQVLEVELEEEDGVLVYEVELVTQLGIVRELELHAGCDGPLLAISNSFGFGGHNSVVAFRTVD